MFPAGRTDGDVDMPLQRLTWTQLSDATGEHYARSQWPSLPPYGRWKVFHMCWTFQRTRPNSYRFMQSPITRSCICSVLEKHIVRRTHRLMRVRRVRCFLSIFWVFSCPT